MSVLLVFTTLPDSDKAVKLAEALVESRCAACVQILPAGRSVYRWKGEIEVSAECALLIKTTEAMYPLLERKILDSHPYDLPEVVAVPVTHGLPAYLDWIARETA